MVNSERRPSNSRFELEDNTIQLEQSDTNLEIQVSINGTNIPVELMRQKPVPTWRSPLTYGEFTDPQLLAEYVVRTQLSLKQPKLRGLRRPNSEAAQQQPADG